MSQGGAGGGQDQDKDTFMLLWVIAGIFILTGVVWYFFKAELINAFIFVKKYEVLAISFFIENDNITRAIKSLSMATPENVTMEYASIYSTFIGQYLMYPIGFVLVVLALIMFRGSATMRFTKEYSMDTLVHQEKENWPQITPVADLALVDEDISEGPWAMAQNQMQFAKKEKLLKVEIVPDRKAAWKAEGQAKATVLKGRATQVFSAQLGPLWSGVDNLPPHTKALYAAFLARIEHDTDACRGYLLKIAKSAASGTVDYSETDALLKKFGDSQAAARCHERHAYVLTVMASMLVLARTDGVLATSDFLWLKPVDRRLWYILNCVGRQVAVPEISGVFAHWLAEKEMIRPLTVPMVEEAVIGLERAIENTVYVPEEGEEIPMAQMH